jgi:hypothetical protein
MAPRQEKTPRPAPKTILRLLDIEQSKNAVLNSLAAADYQESYRHAMERSSRVTVLSLACLLAAASYFDTDFSLRRRASLHRR